MDRFHENIRRARIQKGLSQLAAAEKMGIDRSTFNKFERGKTHLFCENMQLFAEMMGMSEEEILLGDNPAGYLREGSIEDMIQDLGSRLDLLSVQLEQISSAIQKITGKSPSKKEED
jgi:transcriptional regulator with XRE-family HTH domain